MIIMILFSNKMLKNVKTIQINKSLTVFINIFVVLMIIEIFETILK